MKLRIREVRKQQKVTLDELARRVDKAQTTILYYEKGTINISMAMMEKLAKALGCPIAELYVEPMHEELLGNLSPQAHGTTQEEEKISHV